MKSKYRETIVYTLIIALQILVIVYWAGEKINFHVDELYSMGYARNFTNEVDYYQYITICPEFGFDKWVNNADLKKYIEVTEDAKIYHAALPLVVRELIKGRGYYGLLNIAESVIGNSAVSSKPGVFLNVILFILAEIALVRLLKRLHVDEPVRYAGLAMFGFSAYMISTAEYIRFYMLLIMLMLWILNLFADTWNAENWQGVILPGIPAIALVYICYRNSDLTMPFFGAFLICYVVVALVSKKMRQFISGVIVLLGGIAYLLIKTDFIGILLRPNDYLYLKNVWITSSLNISETSSGSVKEYLYWLRGLLENYFFSSVGMIYLLMALLTLGILVSAKRQEAKYNQIDIRKIRPETLAAFLFWIAVFGISFIAGHGKAISILMLFVIIMLGAGEMLDLKTAVKKASLSEDSLFVLIIACEAVIYTVFEALCRHDKWRYYCFAFVSLFIVFWYFIDRLAKRQHLEHARKTMFAALAVFVLVNSILPFKTRNIENIFEDEKGFVENIRRNDDLNVVLISEIEDDTVSRHEAYDCVNLMPDETDIYFVNIADYEYSKVDYPGKFILWSYIDRELDNVISDLKTDGYTIEDLGTDHCSKAYLVQR